jgi:hypothetical protein
MDCLTRQRVLSYITWAGPSHSAKLAPASICPLPWPPAAKHALRAPGPWPRLAQSTTSPSSFWPSLPAPAHHQRARAWPKKRAAGPLHPSLAYAWLPPLPPACVALPSSRRTTKPRLCSAAISAPTVPPASISGTSGQVPASFQK